MPHLLVIRDGSYESIQLRGVCDLPRDATINVPTIGPVPMVHLLRAGVSFSIFPYDRPHTRIKPLALASGHGRCRYST